MPSTVLFAGSSGPLLTTLMDDAAETGETVIRADPRVSEVSWESGRLHLPWSPRSPLSARALTTAGINACGSVDRAVLVAAPAACSASLVDTSISDIERYLDEQLRSMVYLSRELLRHLSAYTVPANAGSQGAGSTHAAPEHAASQKAAPEHAASQKAAPAAGSLIIAVAEPEEAVSESMRSLAYGAVEAFLSTLLDHYRESGPPVYGFIGPESGEQAGAYAAYINSECRDRPGKIRGRLQRYGKRTSLRSLFRS
ncbi:MAG: hypothetical protein ACOCRN_04445 [Spirochaetia bacterium]